MFKGQRKHSKIDKLPSTLKEAVEQMILAGDTYHEIADFMKSNSFDISIASICRHAKTLNANLNTLRIAQENFRTMMEEMDKYPNLDTTEAIIRLASHSMLDALSDIDKDKWSEVSPEKIISSVAGLVRASAHKSKIDLEIKDNLEQGFDSIKEVVFSAMQKENPELYKQVSEFIDIKKDEMLEKE